MKSKSPGSRIEVVTKVMEANDRIAEQNRRRFAEAGVLAIDLIGSPGAGKTALIEATVPRLAAELRMGVVVGDIATTRDADRIAALGIPVVQITTESFGGACHLEAGTVAQSLEKLPLERIDVLFVENVGNLVCPAEFDLGQNERVVVLSVTEGEDKPLKYPLAFREAGALIVSKADLLPHLQFDLESLQQNAVRINPQLRIFRLSSQSGEGVELWTEWIRRRKTDPQSLLK
jgi:hydrogenase nickel incorporation protein HypB